MAVGFTNFVLVPCPVIIDKTIAGVGVVRFDPVEPENARQYQIFGRRKGVVGLRGTRPTEIGPCGMVSPILSVVLNFPSGGLLLVFFEPMPNRDVETG